MSASAGLRHRQEPVAASDSRKSEATRRTSSNAILDTAKGLESKVGNTINHLLGWDDLEHWRRDNGFILTGYRPDSYSYFKSFTSLGYLHNETVNIWSHLLGAIFFLGCGLFMYHEVAPRYETASDSDILVFSCFFAGAVLCLGMSATYHALSNHSPAVSKWGNKLDYTGIVFLIVGSYVPVLYYGFFCEPKLLTTYLSIIILLGLGCGAVSWIDHFRAPEWRTFRASMFVAFGASGVLPVIHGLRIYGYQNLEARMGLSWVILHGIMYIVGAFLYAVRWPERNYPTTFDIWGSSHQIFHIFVVLAAGTHLYGLGQSFDYHHSQHGMLC